MTCKREIHQHTTHRQKYKTRTHPNIFPSSRNFPVHLGTSITPFISLFHPTPPISTSRHLNGALHIFLPFPASAPSLSPSHSELFVFIASFYLARIEQVALHLGTGVPEIFVSCVQIIIKVIGSGTGNPAKVSIPSYIATNGTPLSLPSLASVSSASSDALVSTSPGEGLKRAMPRWRRARRGGWGLRGGGWGGIVVVFGGALEGGSRPGGDIVVGVDESDEIEEELQEEDDAG
ncbi:hypothetical protein DFP72DRAFT_1082591 [Ephemerocybe angulata]|uniref:AA9 family lytic polysaccharide monooxygenase n=1 Tax=Ephemerocybe angulata TaxID=980116 RepID=A0A8H6HA37_9AGAR|nr:hypothetical protein DFP72DRAFT_1082591 [Tulosesus angulatus]